MLELIQGGMPTEQKPAHTSTSPIAYRCVNNASTWDPSTLHKMYDVMV